MVWGTSISKENTEDLERTQKSFLKLILKEKYKDYENALILLNLESLETRRKEMCLNFKKVESKITHYKTYFQQMTKHTK